MNRQTLDRTRHTRHPGGMGTTAPSTRRILGASLVGTAVEFYDFYIYATAASLVFGPLFFPSSDPSAQLLAAYASFAVAFIARPIGALAFGHYGDRIGRKSTLVASLMVMGGSTLAIAFLPTYETAGAFAPLLLCILRFGQGFGLGGEWGGAALLAVENAPPGWRGRFGMVPQLGAPVGFIAANGLFLVLGLTLTEADFLAWGWRLPFLASAILVGLGLWVRLKLTETPAFAALAEHGPPPAVPVAELLRDHWRPTLAGTFGVIACFALFYLATAFALGFGTTKLGYARETFLSVQLFAILFLAAGILLAGWLSDRFSPRAVLAFGAAATIATGLLLAPAAGQRHRSPSSPPSCRWRCSSWALSMGRWAPGCPGCSRRGCAIPARRSPSTWAASSAAGWRRSSPSGWRTRAGWPPSGSIWPLPGSPALSPCSPCAARNCTERAKKATGRAKSCRKPFHRACDRLTGATEVLVDGDIALRANIEDRSNALFARHRRRRVRPRHAGARRRQLYRGR